MKKSIKYSILGVGLLIGVTALSGCTASFCSTDDKAHMLYMYDFGVSEYHKDIGAPEDNRIAVRGFENLFVSVNRPTDSKSGIGYADANAEKNALTVPTDRFFVELDTTVLQHAVLASYNVSASTSLTKFADVPDTYVAKIVAEENVEGTDKISVVDVLSDYGYLKFADSVTEKNVLWTNFDEYVAETRGLVAETNPVLTVDDLPSNDYIKLYKTGLNNSIAAYRSCIAISTDDYGYYGYGSNRAPVEIEGKSWGYAWKKGFLEGLLIYPIAWLTDTFTNAFKPVGAGWAQLLSILLVTVIVRALMLIVTLKQTTGNAKMQALQPEINKIQNKYPNADKNQYEKQRMAEEMQRLYKKNGINPLSTLITLIVQFPVFICVWGGLQGAASLSTGELLGLNLSLTIREVLFNAEAWKTGGAVTALILFLLMAGTQVVSMLLPQWLQKKAAKKAVKLGKNPAKQSQDNKMKWFTYIMMAMIIIMGFSLVSAMGVYWLAGALFSIAQTLITTSITNKKKGK